MMRAAMALAVRFGQLRKACTQTVLAALLAGALSGIGLIAVSPPARAFQQSAAGQFAPAERATVALADLPRQGQQTFRLILQGGPFPHEKDGAVFGNYERQLPSARRGYYREYTVDTPGAYDRGARRIVCGGYRRGAPQACYYTGDHYSSFKKIMP